MREGCTRVTPTEQANLPSCAPKHNAIGPRTPPMSHRHYGVRSLGQASGKPGPVSPFTRLTPLICKPDRPRLCRVRFFAATRRSGGCPSNFEPRLVAFAQGKIRKLLCLRPKVLQPAADKTLSKKAAGGLKQPARTTVDALSSARRQGCR